MRVERLDKIRDRANRILIYPNASPGAGLGHVTRCIALAESLRKQKANVSFICHAKHERAIGYLEEPGWPILTFQSNGPDTVEAGEISRKSDDSGGIDWLVIDNYDIDNSWLMEARGFARGIAVIDDLANRFLDCDLLINQNLGFDNLYEKLVPKKTVQLIGPRFALLRGEFVRLRQTGLRVRDGRIKRILVFMSGSDNADYTGMAARAIGQFSDRGLSVDIVVGQSYRLINDLQKTLPAASFKVNVFQNISANEMARLSDSADLCIGAAGSSSWERCCLGLPSLVIIIAENRVGWAQSQVAQALHAGKAATALGASEVSVECIAGALSKLLDNPDSVKGSSIAAAKLVDGRGAERVADYLLAGCLAGCAHGVR